jgi:acyl transferase domain-containing protein/aryl carrier-like protein
VNTPETAGEKKDLSILKRALIAVKDMRAKLEGMENARREPIAVIGMACRFPGRSNNGEAFWRLLRSGVDAITPVPADRWDFDAYYDPNPDTPGKMYSRGGGFIEDVARFDAKFFGISPREAIRMDPQQRLLLEVAWEALEDAGVSPAGLVRSRTGVFVGISTNDYAQLQIKRNDPNQIDAYFGTGGSMSIAAGRLSYFLGLQGPALALDTTCSSSLMAIDLAVQYLRSLKCDYALAGGVNLMLSPEATIILCKHRALAADGRCKTFDSAADGYGRGEGCGMILLKRLSDAIADGDNVLAMIRGTASNHDGRSSGITVPNGLAQQEVIRRALEDAGLQPAQVSYVEAHGTGTSLGDPIELRALGAVVGQGRREGDKVLVGSVKTNIGHLEAAAGVAAVIKVVLALQHAEIPASLHLRNPNPYIPWDDLPVTVPTVLTPWTSENGPRIAGVSAFGFSGTNVHLILQSAPAPESRRPEVERRQHLLMLSATQEAPLKDLAARYKNHLESSPSQPLGDICFTAAVGRSHFEERLAVLGNSSSEMAEKLSAFIQGQEAAGLGHNRTRSKGHPKVAFLFTGEGSQYVGMGRALYESQPAFRHVLEKCDEVLRSYLEQPLLSVLYPEFDAQPLRDPGHRSRFDETMYAQPCLFALEYALAELWRSWGIEPSVVMGHGVGEYAAACTAGVFSMEDALKLICQRARLMQTLPNLGGTAVVFADEETVAGVVEKCGKRASIAGMNRPGNVLISGDSEDIDAILQMAEIDGVGFSLLSTSPVFRSPPSESMLDEFKRVAEAVSFSRPRIGVIASLTGNLARGRELEDAAYWCRHTYQPARFVESMSTLCSQNHRFHIEMGPSPVMAAIGARCSADSEGFWLPSLRRGRDEWHQMLESLAQLYLQGVEVDWIGFDRGYLRRKVQLPTYPFRRERYWLETVEPGTGSKGARQGKDDFNKASHPLLGRRWRGPLPVFETQLNRDATAFMNQYRVHNLAILPEAVSVEMFLGAAVEGLGNRSPTIEDMTIRDLIVLPENQVRNVQVILVPEGEQKTSIRLYSLNDNDGPEQTAWRLHAAATIRDGEKDGDADVLLRERITLADIQARFPKDSILDYRERLQRHGRQWDERCRIIEGFWSRDGEVLGLIELNDELVAQIDSFQLHPALLDTCFQVLLAGKADGGDKAHKRSDYLLNGIQRLTLYGRVGARVWSHCIIREADGRDEERLVGDLQLLDETGRLVAVAEGLRFRPATGESLRYATQQSLSEWLYEIEWQPKLEERHEGSASQKRPDQTGKWLIFADKNGIGESLARLLEEHGEDCFLIFAGQSFEKTGARHWTTNPARPEDFRDAVHEIRGIAEQPFCGVVHLWSLDAGSPGQMTAASLEQDLVLSSGSALHLVQALSSAEAGKHARLWLVTRGAQTVGTDSLPSAIGQAPLWGLGKVVAVEHPEMWGGLVDLDAGGSAEEVSMLFQEIKNPGSEDHLAFRREQRYVARLAHSKRQEMPLEPMILQPDGTYLITGGLGGLGIEVARWMVDRGARNLVLVGRSGVSDRAREAISRLEKSGARVVVQKGDVSQKEDVNRVLEYILQHMPPLRGIVHAAAVIDDGLLVRQDWKRFLKVFSPKAQGAWNMHVLTQHIPLEFFVLFSSVVTLFGSEGQGSYVTANAFLDALAHLRQAQGLPGLSINWGAWSDVGVAAERNLGQRISMQGMSFIAPHQGLQVLEELLQRKGTQTAVLPIHWKKFRRFSPRAGELRLLKNIFEEERVEAHEFGTAPAGKTMIREEFLAAEPAERKALLKSYLEEQVARVLRISNTRLDPHQFLATLGLDSLMALELRNRIQADLGVVLTLESLLRDASIDQMAHQLMGQLTGSTAFYPDDAGLLETKIDDAWEVMEL